VQCQRVPEGRQERGTFGGAGGTDDAKTPLDHVDGLVETARGVQVTAQGPAQLGGQGHIAVRVFFEEAEGGDPGHVGVVGVTHAALRVTDAGEEPCPRRSFARGDKGESPMEPGMGILVGGRL
jgi:hypothetical protein